MCRGRSRPSGVPLRDREEHCGRSPVPAAIGAPERIAAADAYLAGFDVEVVEGGDVAGYQRTTDTIVLPTIDRFETAAGYYATRAHETVHATGHPSRLARSFGDRFGDKAYAAEELVAELGAAFWCAQAGISSATRSDHAAYLAGWLKILRQDPRSGDWGEVDADDKAANDHAVILGGRVLSAYRLPDNTRHQLPVARPGRRRP
jgi:antirestriction protein ArdC